MTELLLWLVLVLTVIAVVLLIAVLVGRTRDRLAVPPEQVLREELRLAHTESGAAASQTRDELAKGLQASNQTLRDGLAQLGGNQQARFESIVVHLRQLNDSNRLMLDRIRETFDTRLDKLQEGNEKKLDEMRRTVDEKLSSTLERRLGESFRLVSDRLEAVHKGLGEMQSLATGVGDLKRVLTNVKSRGTWAEVQLGAILEQILSPSQFERNVRPIADSQEVVEYAVRLPGPTSNPDGCVWLPIDAKFPQEDYVRLREAAESGDQEAVSRATDALIRAVRQSAKSICEKYLDPPATTDFAIMFLATEGLYAEIARQSQLVDQLQQEFRVVIAGPTNLTALLSALRMGFRTLAIEQRAAEVWSVLGAVRNEFGKFAQVLAKVKRQLATASRTIDETGVRTRAMQRKLSAVEELPADQASALLKAPLEIDEHPLDDSTEALKRPADTDNFGVAAGDMASRTDDGDSAVSPGFRSPRRLGRSAPPTGLPSSRPTPGLPF